MKLLRHLALGIVLTLGAPVFANEGAEWRAVDAETGKIRDIAELEQLARDFPDSGSVRLRLLQPYLEAGEIEKVMATLEWLYDRGYVFGEVPQRQIPKLLEGVDPGRIAERLRAEAEVIEASKVIATTPAEAGLVESLLIDLDGNRIAATSVTGRAVWGMAPDGNWMPFAPEGADNLSGIGFEGGSGRLWVASGNIDGSERDDARFSGLISPGMGRGEDLRIAAPEGVRPSDIHVLHDGTMFASDPMGGGIYIRNPGGETLETLIAPGTLRSPQGLATSEDGSKLYVSDYRYGLAIVDLETREVSRLTTDLSIILDGVDGLWRYGNELIAVQNGTSPMRISAFELSEDGLSIIGHRVLEQAHPEWTEPLGGAIAKDTLVYIGNGQWDRFVVGEPAQGKPALPTQIRRLPLQQ